MARARQASKSTPKSPKAKKARASAPVKVSPRIARRERRRGQSREEIIEAARRVVLREGIGATTLEAIAKEVGLTKAALYYYFPSKDAILFELTFTALESQALAVDKAVASSESGAEALRAVLDETVRGFADRLDDFRLTYLHGQLAAPGSVHISDEQLARIRPLNEIAYGGAARKISPGNQAGVEPRLMAFMANLAAIGVLTLKGMVESVGDPLLYSDEQLIEGFARIFAAAAEPTCQG